MKNIKPVFFFLCFISCTLSLQAQSFSETASYRVYGWETLRRGWVEAMVWNIGFLESDRSFFWNEELHPKDQLFFHSAEVAYGVTDRFTVGAYGDFRNSPETNLRFFRFRAVARYRLFGAFSRVFRPTIYLEYYLPNAKSGESAELESRLILERDFNDFRLLLNPAVSFDLSGEDVKEGVNGNFYAGLYWRRYFFLQPGIEYYGRYGELQEWPNQSERPHLLFLNLTLQPTPGLKWELGGGKGLTSGSDDYIIKSILTYEFQTLRPSKQAY